MDKVPLIRKTKTLINTNSIIQLFEEQNSKVNEYDITWKRIFGDLSFTLSNSESKYHCTPFDWNACI